MSRGNWSRCALFLLLFFFLLLIFGLLRFSLIQNLLQTFKFFLIFVNFTFFFLFGSEKTFNIFFECDKCISEYVLGLGLEGGRHLRVKLQIDLVHFFLLARLFFGRRLLLRVGNGDVGAPVAFGVGLLVHLHKLKQSQLVLILLLFRLELIDLLLHSKDLGFKLGNFVHHFPFGISILLSLFGIVTPLFMLFLLLLLKDRTVRGMYRASRGTLDGVSGLVVGLFAFNQL